MIFLKSLKALVSISQTALSLFTYTYMKFLSFLTQRLSFCSTNVVKVQVSSILKEKKKFRNTKSVVPSPNYYTTEDSLQRSGVI